MSPRFSYLSLVIVLGSAGMVIGAAHLSGSGTGAPTRQESDADVVFARVGEYVREYVARARHVMALETVTLQPLRSDLSPADRPRRLEFDVRVEWTPGTDGRPGSAQVHRELVRINGRPPRPRDEPGCQDPEAVSPEPLEMFLPEQQRDYFFTFVGRGRHDRRPAVLVDYRARTEGPVTATWNDDCVRIELPGRSMGRVWLDALTGAVLRIDERLRGTYDIEVPPKQQARGGRDRMTIERVDSSVQYKEVTFTDPSETVLMPVSIETLTVIRNAGIERMRTRQVLSRYRRFVTEGRLLD